MKNFNSLDAAYKVELNNNLGLSLRFLANGNLAAISYKNLLVNLLEGNFVDASVANIYLRVYDETGISSAPLIGVLSSSKFNANSGQVSWHGNTLGLDYVVSCSLAKDMNLWLWQVKITNHCLRGISYDLIYAQDVGIADVGAVRTNEAYTCQYIDHAILSHPTLGYAVASRQNVAQTIDGAASFPWLLQGGLNKVANYSTDGFQFYGLHYRETNAPQTLVQHNLPSSCLQYEFALTGLQQEKVTLAAAEQAESTFFAYFMPDHAEISSLDDLQYYAKASEFAQSVAKFVPSQNFAATSSILNTTQMLKVNDLDASDLAQFFGSDLRHVEQQDGKVLSFFYSGSSESSKSRHVVLKAKELQVERPHGHVIFSGTDSDFEVHRLSSTIYMSGIFNSQVTLGNTSFNKLLSVPRNHLNVFKFSGQRIFMRDSDGCFAQLGIPSALEIGVNFARWIYKFADELIEVKTWTDAVSHQLNLTIDSKVAHQFLITHNIVAGVNEDDSHPSISYGENKSVLIQADRSELIVTENPQATFYILPHNSSDVAKISDARALSSVECAKELPYIVYETNLLTHFGLILGGELDFADASRAIKDEEKAQLEEKGMKLGENVLEFKLALDGLTMVINKENTWAKEMTKDEIVKMYLSGSYNAEDVVKWSDIRADWPAEEIKFYGPNENHGTFEFFFEKILDEQDMVKTANLQQEYSTLVDLVSNDKNAIAFFGYGYYASNQDKLQAVHVDFGNGPVEPTLETIGEDLPYAGFTRPVFTYLNADYAKERPHGNAQARHLWQSTFAPPSHSVPPPPHPTRFLLIQ